MRVVASQELPRDSGESILAARHLDVSQGPLGWCRRCWRNFTLFGSLPFCFLRFFHFFCFSRSPMTRASNCNSVAKWGISLRPPSAPTPFRTSRRNPNRKTSNCGGILRHEIRKHQRIATPSPVSLLIETWRNRSCKKLQGFFLVAASAHRSLAGSN